MRLDRFRRVVKSERQEWALDPASQALLEDLRQSALSLQLRVSSLCADSTQPVEMLRIEAGRCATIKELLDEIEDATKETDNEQET